MHGNLEHYQKYGKVWWGRVCLINKWKSDPIFGDAQKPLLEAGTMIVVNNRKGPHMLVFKGNIPVEEGLQGAHLEILSYFGHLIRITVRESEKVLFLNEDIESDLWGYATFGDPYDYGFSRSHSWILWYKMSPEARREMIKEWPRYNEEIDFGGRRLRHPPCIPGGPEDWQYLAEVAQAKETAALLEHIKDIWGPDVVITPIK